MFVLHPFCFVILKLVMHPERDALADVGSLVSLHYCFQIILFSSRKLLNSYFAGPFEGLCNKFNLPFLTNAMLMLWL